ncbi:MAG TPA: T9SS type A sorting domain-containing protein [Candidatus Kapabacteria bacterium]|nr:T9SS type A sorting domain-containing protein [Candidatus Kapabacteria bacterium]
MPIASPDAAYMMYVSDTAIVVMTRDTTGIVRTRDRGRTWERITANLPWSRLHIFVRPAGPWLFMGADSGLYQSSDDGLTWRTTTIDERFRHNMYCAVEYHGALFLSGDSGVFRSTDQGRTWTRVFTGRDSQTAGRDMHSDGDRLYTMLWWRRFIRTSDDGATWDTVLRPLRSAYINDYLPVGDTLLIAADSLYRSVDGGKAYSGWLFPKSPRSTIRYANVLGRSGSAVFALIDDGRAFRSDDFGANWVDVSDGLPGYQPNSIQVRNDTAYILTYQAGIWYRPLSEMLSPAGLRNVWAGLAAPQHAAVWPNPAHTSATLGYHLAQGGQVRIELYDLLQRRCATLLDEVQDAGAHTVAIDARALAAGTYFYTLTTGGRVANGRFVVAR